MNILLALVSVSLFSLTVPLTRLVTLEMSPMLVTLMRLLAGGLFCWAIVQHDRWIPPRDIWLRLSLTSFSCVVLFALLMAFALQQVPGSHGAVALAALPAVTVAYACIRERLNPGVIFWVFALLGTGLSFSYFLTSAVDELMLGDALLGCLVITTAFGYVEGARLSRDHGGRRIMSWAILMTLPFTVLTLIVLSFFSLGESYWQQIRELSARGWACLFYLGFISQSAAMFLWYRVLAKGPMEKVAMMQLLQPFMTLLGAMILLGETIHPIAWIIAFLVSSCIFGANRVKTRKQSVTSA